MIGRPHAVVAVMRDGRARARSRSLLSPLPVFADPAGPDRLPDRGRVDRARLADDIDVQILGGDAFVELTADPGTDVVVVGYSGEPYLWFRPDGAVLENQNSPATADEHEPRRQRCRPAHTPTDADAEPDWKQIASDHRWAWHDHRAHWMQTDPAGRRVAGRSDPRRRDPARGRRQRRSRSPSPAGGSRRRRRCRCGSGALLGGLCRRRRGRLRRRRRSPDHAVAVPPAVLALVAGLWQYLSLPAATGPAGMVWWLLPGHRRHRARSAAIAGRVRPGRDSGPTRRCSSSASNSRCGAGSSATGCRRP